MFEIILFRACPEIFNIELLNITDINIAITEVKIAAFNLFDLPRASSFELIFKTACDGLSTTISFTIYE